MTDKSERLHRFFAKLGEAAGQEGLSVPESCRALVARKNAEQAAAFAEVPFDRRMIFLPHCLRVLGPCTAREQAHEYLCGRCGACAADAILEKAETLGYGPVKMLKGGSAVARILDAHHPGAVLGVACGFEGTAGILECESRGIPVQSVPLLRDGCAETTVALDEVFTVMAALRPRA